MFRAIVAAGVAGALAVAVVLPAVADDAAAPSGDLLLSSDGGALDSASLDGVSGGAVFGTPMEEGGWRDADSLAIPIDIPSAVDPISSGVSGASHLGAGMGAAPPGANAIPGSAAMAGHTADILF